MSTTLQSSGFDPYVPKRAPPQLSKAPEESDVQQSLPSNITTDDIIKVYDNFFRDHFKDHPKYSEIQSEYSEFKNEIMQLVTDLSDDDFQTYAQRKAGMMKSRIAQLCVMPPQHAISVNPQFATSVAAHFTKKNFLLDFIRGATVSERPFDEFTSTFRNRNVREIVKDGVIANLGVFGKSQQPLLFREIKKSSEISNDLAMEMPECNSIISLLRLAEKQQARVMDFSSIEEYNPLVIIFAAVFITSLEKPLHSFRLITEYLMDLYNLSQFYGVKSPHQQTFDRWSRYLQQILQEAATKNFENDASYHGYVLGLFYRTVHHPDVLKGIKLYLATSIKVFLEFMNPTLILSILGLNPAATGSDSPGAIRSQLLDFITNHVEREPKFSKSDEVVSYMEANKNKILRLVKLAGYCLSGSFECATFFNQESGPFTVSSPYKSEAENSFVICVPVDRKAIFGYGEQSRTLLEILKKTEPSYGIEDFLSVSENESSSGRLTPPPMEPTTYFSNKPSLVGPNADRQSSSLSAIPAQVQHPDNLNLVADEYRTEDLPSSQVYFEQSQQLRQRAQQRFEQVELASSEIAGIPGRSNLLVPLSLEEKMIVRELRIPVSSSLDDRLRLLTSTFDQNFSKYQLSTK